MHLIITGEYNGDVEATHGRLNLLGVIVFILHDKFNQVFMLALLIAVSALLGNI